MFAIWLCLSSLLFQTRTFSLDKLLSVVDAKKDGQFNIALAGELWLKGNSSCIGVSINDVTHFGGSSGTLIPTFSNSTGKDKLGSYTALSYHWSLDKTIVLVSTIRIYQQGTFIVFEQKFPMAIKNSGEKYSTDNPGYNTYFPCFARNAGKLMSLSWFTFNGKQSSEFDIGHGDGLDGYISKTQGGSPIALFDGNNQVLVFSQLDNIKVGRIGTGPNKFQSGILGTIKEIPSGWKQSFIMVAGKEGINSAMMDWGDLLLLYSGKERTPLYSTPITSTVGFWTDNGGYYHYGGFEKKTGGYFEAMKKVHEYHQSIEMPFGHWQLDSWWYLKGDNNKNGSSQTSKFGTYNWIADPYVFPNGVPSLHSLVGVPLQLHNRYFNNNNAYISLLPDIKWTDQKKSAVLPLDPCAFWSYFFTQQIKYGMVTYEQDFLDAQWDKVPALGQNITLARDWLQCMATAAVDHNLTIQYCMSYPNDHLVASQHSNVVTIRASRDYEPSSKDSWRIGQTSLLAWSLGTLPFKDVFLSSSGIHEKGGAKRASAIEYNSDLEALVSILSASSVGPGDGLNYLNKTRLMQVCDQCGNLLKPDRPATTVDSWFQATYKGGIDSQLTTTHSTIYDKQGYKSEIVYVLAANFNQTINLTLHDIGIDKEKNNYVSYDWYDGVVRPFTKTTPITVIPTKISDQITQYKYIVVSPVSISGWVFIGQLKKFVTASARTVASISVNATTMTAELMGHCTNEIISICAVHSSDWEHIVCQQATFSFPGNIVVVTWSQ